MFFHRPILKSKQISFCSLQILNYLEYTKVIRDAVKSSIQSVQHVSHLQKYILHFFAFWHFEGSNDDRTR